jgi:hypothetical protein
VFLGAVVVVLFGAVVVVDLGAVVVVLFGIVVVVDLGVVVLVVSVGDVVLVVPLDAVVVVVVVPEGTTVVVELAGNEVAVGSLVAVPEVTGALEPCDEVADDVVVVTDVVAVVDVPALPLDPLAGIPDSPLVDCGIELLVAPGVTDAVRSEVTAAAVVAGG